MFPIGDSEEALEGKGAGSLWGYENATDSESDYVASWNFASRGQFKWFPLRSSGKEYSNGGKPFIVEAGPSGVSHGLDLQNDYFLRNGFDIEDENGSLYKKRQPMKN